MTRSTDNRENHPDALRQQAWEWLRLFHSGAVKPHDAERFKRWLASDPAHGIALKEAKQQWAVIGPASAKLLRVNSEAAALHERASRMPFVGRRAFLGAAGSAAAVIGVAVFHPPEGLWPPPGEWGADYRTATGQQLVVTLAGRIQVTLNTQTSIRRHTVGAETAGIDLLTGEAAIDLPTGGSGRLFSVAAGVGRSLAESGRFEVRHLDGKVCVTCIEGAVQVLHRAGNRELRARQQTVYDGGAIGSLASIESDQVAAWRNGELVFTQTRLAEVLDEINRYRPGRVVLMNTGARNMPVTGSFYIASLDLALAQLQHAFDLDARSLPGGLILLS